MLCLTGVHRYTIERDIFRELLKYIKDSSKEQARQIPLKSIHKKRGQAFAFLNFETQDQLDEFKDSFLVNMAGKKVMNKVLTLQECRDMKKVEGKRFKSV